jgi:phosphate uptake regulator
MPTGFEVKMYHDIAAIAQNSERIADALEKIVESVTFVDTPGTTEVPLPEGDWTSE